MHTTNTLCTAAAACHETHISEGHFRHISFSLWKCYIRMDHMQTRGGGGGTVKSRLPAAALRLQDQMEAFSFLPLAVVYQLQLYPQQLQLCPSVSNSDIEHQTENRPKTKQKRKRICMYNTYMSITHVMRLLAAVHSQSQWYYYHYRLEVGFQP